MGEVVTLSVVNVERRRHGQCQRCPRVDYLPWSTEHGVMYCGHCWEADAIAYVFRDGGDVGGSTKP